MDLQQIADEVSKATPKNQTLESISREVVIDPSETIRQNSKE